MGAVRSIGRRRRSAERRGVDLRGADLYDEDVSGLPLTRMLAGPEKVVVTSEDEYQADAETHLEGVSLAGAHLEGAVLSSTSHAGANLAGAHLEAALLVHVKMSAATLAGAQLAGADLRRATLDPLTRLESASFGAPCHGYALVGGVRWSGADLTGVDWTPVLEVGDEPEARRRRVRDGARKSRAARLAEYNDAIKTYRRLVPSSSSRD
jgi:uncharacterized protein YjbI with pentapeptide repeats